MSRVFTEGTSSSVAIAASASINNLAAFTYAAWIFPTAGPDPNLNYSVITSKDPNTSEIEMCFSSQAPSTNALVGLGFNNTVDAFSASVDNTIVLNVWQRVVMTFDFNGDKKFHLYKNGVEVSYRSQTALTGSQFNDSGGNFYVGNGQANDIFGGSIAGVKLWNTALTALQVAADYAGTNVLPGNLVDSLTFLTNQGATEPDVSGNSNVGVITNAAFSSNNPPVTTMPYSVPDCRTTKPSSATSRNVNGTLTYDVQTSSNHAIPPVDSRTAGAPVACGTYPQNSRTPGTFGPGE